MMREARRGEENQCQQDYPDRIQNSVSHYSDYGGNVTALFAAKAAPTLLIGADGFAAKAAPTLLIGADGFAAKAAPTLLIGADGFAASYIANWS
jgi:hypothetical protein